MIRRKILLALILVLGLTASSWGATFEVGTGKEFATIQEALYSADVLCDSEDTEIEITLSSPLTLPGVISFSGSESDYDKYIYSNIKVITITGGTLNAASGVRHFVIDSSNADVTFDGVTFRGGSGGIEISAGTLDITDSPFSNCSAATGGALYVTGGTVTVTGTEFSSNSATSGNGGAISITGGSVTIDGATFTGNSASGNGGAVYAATGATLAFTGANTFTSSNKAASGGAIYTQVPVTFGGDSTFSNNAATSTTSGSGGAIYSEGALTFSGAAAFDSNTAATDGGAVYTTGNAAFSGTAKFTGNKATGGNGGAIYATGTLSFTGAPEFASNTAATDGGAIYTTGNATFSSTAKLTSNKSSSNGGAIYFAGTSLEFTGAPEFSSNAVSADGGALYVNNGTVTFSAAPTFKGNTAKSNGGAVYIASSKRVDLSSGANFTDANSAANGGAVFVGGTLSLAGDINFTGNTATNGGALYISNSGVVEDDSDSLIFTNNSSSAYIADDDDNYDEANLPSGNGGAIYTAGTLEFNVDAAFNNNKAPSGGAIYVAGSTTTFNGTASFGTGTANTAYNGGAIYVAGGTVTFNDEAAFTGNNALNNGGAVYVAGGSLKFADTSSAAFTSNKANTDEGTIGNGGAVYWGTSAANFNNAFGSASSVSFTDNSVLSSLTESDTVDYSKAFGNGGAIYCTGSGTLTVSSKYKFSGNTADSNGGAIFTTNAKILIENVDITETNKAEWGGGGFAATSSGDITVNYSSICSQDAKLGGALYAENMKITSSDFTNNSSGSGGGGAIATFYKNDTGEVTITESTFTQNETDGRGGAILARTSNFTVTNTFFGTNTANDNGGAIDIGGESSTTMQQSTFANNVSKKSGGAIYADGDFRIEGSKKARVAKNLGRCYFISNNAQGFGGAIHYDQRDKAGDFSVQGSLFENNVATDGSGGAINVLSDVAKIESCTFDNNGSGGDSNAVNGYGGGAVFMFVTGANVSEGRDSGVIRNCVFARNKVEGGGTNSCGGAVSILGTVKVISCTISLGNNAATYGGAVFVGNNATLIISGTIAVGNTARNGNDIYKGDGANIETGGYNRIGVYGTGGNNTGWITDVGVESDREGANWSKADFFSDNNLADNIRSDSIPPTVGSSVGNIDTKRLPSLMLKEAESLPLADRATTIIPYTLRYNFPQYDIRGVDRWALGTAIDIGAVFYDGTVRGDEDNENSYYSIASIKISGIPNSMKAIGQTASLLAVIRYTNGRSAFAGNGTNQEKVTWSSIPAGNNIIKITQDGVITSIGEGTARIRVETQRAKQDGTKASDTQAVTVTGYNSVLNLAPEFFNEYDKFLDQLYEYDMSVAMVEPNTSVISSSAFQNSFKNKWGTSPSAILDMSEVYPDFSLKKASEYKASSILYLAAAQAQRPGINVTLPERTDGDLLPLTYSWILKGSDIKYLLGDDYKLGSADAKLAADLFSVMSINLTTANDKNINVVNADNAKDLFNSKALVLSKADSNNGVHIELTAYIAHVDGGTGSQLVNNLLIVPDNLEYDEILNGTMWLAYGKTTSNNNNNNKNNNSDGNSDSNSGGRSGGGGGGGGCNSLAIGLIAAGLLFALKRR